MHKYYWETATSGDGSGPRTDADVAATQPLATGQLPPELRHDDPYSGNVRLPPKLMPYGLPAVCGDSKLLTSGAENDYSSGYHDYVAYGYSPTAQDMASVMLANAGYNHQTAPVAGYPCQRMSATSSPAQFAADAKAGLLPHGNSAELYQWVREQQQFAAANAIGITPRFARSCILNY